MTTFNATIACFRCLNFLTIKLFFQLYNSLYSMDNIQVQSSSATLTEWYSEDFIYNAVVAYLKDNGYKVQKETPPKDGVKPERIINASKFFKKEIIEVKGFPQFNPHNPQHATLKTTHHAKNWFSEALINSFANFGTFENADVAMALPNVSRYKAIVEKLHEYFTANDLYFSIYLVNEDGAVEVSNLNEKVK